jgi:hypothetical protein
MATGDGGALMDVLPGTRGADRVWNHVEAGFAALAVRSGGVLRLGGGADPLVLFHRSGGRGVLAVFDAVGGRVSGGESVQCTSGEPGRGGKMSQATGKCAFCGVGDAVEGRRCRECPSPPDGLPGKLPELRRQASLERATITLTPPPSPRIEPVVEQPRRVPVVRRPSARTLRRVLVALALGTGAFLLLSNWDDLTDLVETPVPTSAPESAAGFAGKAGKEPCPAAVAKWLPGGGGGAVLIARHNADRFVVTVCQGADGQYRYDGLVRGAEATSKTHISLPATRTEAGFVARNKDFQYELTASELVLSNNGKEVSRWPLTPAQS